MGPEVGRLGGTGSLSRGPLLLALLGSSAFLAAGCGDDAKEKVAALPARVEQKHDAIVSAAQRLDFAGLRRLIDPATFSYSFGETGDPVGYWRRLERDEMPVVGDYLPAVLAAPVGRQRNIYVWPAAHAKKPSRWTAADRRWLRRLYSAREIRTFERAGAYLGWRAGIRRDGKWLFFISGD